MIGTARPIRSSKWEQMASNPKAPNAAHLRTFVRERMKMSSYYQPLIIRSLVEAGGRMATEDLARRLLVEDRFAVDRALRTLMRWPRTTLMNHGIVEYDRKRRELVLLASFDSDEQRDVVVAECTSAIANWQRSDVPKYASSFYNVIENASGRCEACGVPGSIRAIDVDHIVPRSHARRGYVKLKDGTQVPVHDPRNLQALCSKCNRGKRATSTFDFRPSRARLAETISLTLERAAALGYDPTDILSRATANLGQGARTGDGRRGRQA
jgi:5-methylcytosine-specific restriction endonuclease McrA